MYTLDYNIADSKVASWQRDGMNVAWNGWDLVFMSADPSAERSPYGSYQNGAWGYAATISPNSNGQWLIPARILKGSHGSK